MTGMMRPKKGTSSSMPTICCGMGMTNSMEKSRSLVYASRPFKPFEGHAALEVGLINACLKLWALKVFI
jgi:hypothetical protein